MKLFSKSKKHPGSAKHPNKGFGSMTPEQRSEIARMGGKAKSKKKGFGSMEPERLREVARKGGQKGKRVYDKKD